MRILMINRPKDAWIGGDYIQMEKTAEALRKLGHEVDISETPLISPPLKMLLYDVVHVFNFSFEWAKWGIWASIKKGIPVVCSMIYHAGDNWVSYEHQQLMWDSLSAGIFLTEGEIERAESKLKIDKKKCHIIPNGLDEWWFKGVSVPNDTPDYVLTVGRIEPSKGQLWVTKAAKQLGLQHVCIGEVRDESYAMLCEKAGSILLPPTEQEKLLNFYASCKVYALVSSAEVMPLSVMEAGAQARNIILTDHCEWKVPNAEYMKYKDVEGIKRAIMKSLLKPRNVELQNMLKEMTWEKVAKQLEIIYNGLRKE